MSRAARRAGGDAPRANVTPTIATVLVAAGIAGCARPPEVDHPKLDVEVPAHWSARATEGAVTGEADGTDEADAGERAASAPASRTAGGPEGTARGADEEGPARPDDGKPWWRRFGDASLDRAVAAVLEHNHDLRLAVERVHSAAAQARIAGADRLPRADASVAGARARRNFIGFPIPGGGDVLTTRATTWDFALDLSWELDLWGRMRAGHSAALADVQAAGADARGARLSLIGQAVTLWLQIVETGQQLELAGKTVESFRATHEIIADRYERGLRPSVDVRLSRSSIATAEASREARRERLDRLRRRLEVLAGRYPEGELAASETLPELPPPVPAGLPSELVGRRPDLAAAERRLAAAGARVDEARRALYPRFSLSASGGTSSSELSDLANGNFSVWTLAGNLAQPVMQGGRLVAGLDLARNRERRALLEYVGTALAAYSEVEAALAAEPALREREARLAEAARQSRAASDLARDRYERGVGSLIDVLEAQRRAFENESRRIEVHRLRLENRVELHLALGGDLREPLSPREPAVATSPP